MNKRKSNDIKNNSDSIWYSVWKIPIWVNPLVSRMDILTIRIALNSISRLFPGRGKRGFNGRSPSILNGYPAFNGFIIDEEDFAGSGPVIQANAFAFFFDTHGKSKILRHGAIDGIRSCF